MARSLTWRYNSIQKGIEIHEWIPAHVAPNGQIDWQGGLPYELTYYGTYLIRAAFLNFVVNINPEEHAIEKIKIVDPAHPMLTKLVFGYIEHTLADFFDHGQGPLKYALDEKRKDLEQDCLCSTKKHGNTKTSH